MKNSKRIIGIIPARGGSKGVIGKNIKLLAGKPLIYYTIAAAKNSQYLDKVIVSTDNDEIAKVSEQYRAEVLKRPQDLARDNTPMFPVIEHVLLQNKADIVVLLQPTSPLRTNLHIDEAIDRFFQGNYDSLLSCCSSHAFIWKDNQDSAFALNYDFKKRINRQDKEPEYKENGAIYISKYEVLMQDRHILDRKVGLYVMPKECSLEIDDEFDFKLSEEIKKYEN